MPKVTEQIGTRNRTRRGVSCCSCIHSVRQASSLPWFAFYSATGQIRRQKGQLPCTAQWGVQEGPRKEAGDRAFSLPLGGATSSRGDRMSGFWGADQPVCPGSHEECYVVFKTGTKHFSLLRILGAWNKPEFQTHLLNYLSCVISFQM